MGNPDRNRSVARLDGTPRRRHDVGGDLDRAIAVEDLRAIAHRRLPRFVLEYLEGGAGEEATLCVERSACADWRFTPRQLVDGASAASPPGSSAAPPRCLWWWRRPD